MSATLSDIRTKFRRITKAPSQNQITDAQVDQYINTFYLYDFPEHLRLFQLEKTYEFTCDPNVDSYPMPVNEYLTFSPPLYVAGYESYWTQSRSEFYRMYPIVRNIVQIGAGNGSVGPYNFTLSAVPVVAGQVLINTLDVSGNPLKVVDDGLGNLIGDVAPSPAVSTINYLTGAISVSFSAGVMNAQPINSQTVPYVASRPQAMLVYDSTFTLRPIPDQSYTITMNAFIKPTEFLALNPTAQEPELREWWQALAMGAALKFFEDRGDFPQIANYRPLFDEQMRLIQRRTLVQQVNERSATIYTDQGYFGQGTRFGPF